MIHLAFFLSSLLAEKFTKHVALDTGISYIVLASQRCQFEGGGGLQSVQLRRGFPHTGVCDHQPAQRASKVPLLSFPFA